MRHTNKLKEFSRQIGEWEPWQNHHVKFYEMDGDLFVVFSETMRNFRGEWSEWSPLEPVFMENEIKEFFSYEHYRKDLFLKVLLHRKYNS